MIYVPKYKNEFSEDAKMLVEENGEVFKADMPKQEMPEFKEEVSEDAKMLVEDGGKIVRTPMVSGGGGLFVINYDVDNHTKDKSFEEIVDAILNGKVVYFSWGDSYVPISKVDIDNSAITMVYFGSSVSISENGVYVD
jgi:hypothetical protein